MKMVILRFKGCKRIKKMSGPLSSESLLKRRMKLRISNYSKDVFERLGIRNEMMAGGILKWGPGIIHMIAARRIEAKHKRQLEPKLNFEKFVEVDFSRALGKKLSKMREQKSESRLKSHAQPLFKACKRYFF